MRKALLNVRLVSRAAISGEFIYAVLTPSLRGLRESITLFRCHWKPHVFLFSRLDTPSIAKKVIHKGN